MIGVWLAACRRDETVPQDPPGVAIETASHSGLLPAPVEGPNVLMISIDTLRRDHVDWHATDGEVRMPFLSSLMAEGQVFDDHLSCSNWTFHATSCLLTGRLPEDYGWMARMGKPATVVPDQSTLASRLSDAGWLTVLASSNSWLGPSWNNAQGYERIPLASARDATSMLRQGTDELLEALAEQPADRWFLHVHVKDPHVSYDPPVEYLDGLSDLPPIPFDLSTDHYDATDAYPAMTPEEQAALLQHLRLRYNGELRWLDDQLNAEFDRLRDEGWLENTIVVVWTDHGEQFFERGEQTHAYDLNVEENLGLLFFWGEGVSPEVVTLPTHGVDVLPMVLDKVGLPFPDDTSLAGLPLSQILPDRVRYTAAAARNGPKTAVIRNGEKLVAFADGRLAYYETRVDPLETTAVTNKSDPRVLALWELLAPRFELLRAAVPDEDFTDPYGEAR